MFSLGLVSASHAGIPLLLKVTKNENQDIRAHFQARNYNRRSGADVLTYSIQLINAGQTPIKDVEVKWAILMRARSSTKQKLTEGSSTASLDKMGKFALDTDPVDIRQIWRSSVSTHSSDVMEEVGHTVEVIVDGKVVASEIKPMDVKPKIEAARRAEEGARKAEQAFQTGSTRPSSKK